MNPKFLKSTVLFFIVFMLFAFSISYYLLFNGTMKNGNPREGGSSTLYVYSALDVQKMLEKNSLSNFSGIKSYPWVGTEIEAVHSSLLRNNCPVPEMSEMFYRTNINVLSPTLAYMAYELFECEGTNVTKKDEEYTTRALNEYKERFVRDDAFGISIQRALGELIVYWQIGNNNDPSSTILNERILIPYLKFISNGSPGKRVYFEISNITQLKKTLNRFSTSNWRTLRGNMAFEGIIELNESEKLYKEGYISAAYWHYCMALGYYEVSKSSWAGVPGYGLKNMAQTQKDYPYNITGIREKVYSDAIQLFKSSNKPYELDLFAMYILQDIYSIDNSLNELTDKERSLYTTLLPSQIYESYLTVEAEIIGAKIFKRTLDDHSKL